MNALSQEPHPPWFHNKIPAREDSVLPYLLERNAREQPDQTCFRFADGSTWTCAETLEKAQATAGLLRQQGVGPGDLVIAWLPSGEAIIRTWFALNYLGAVFVPLNTDYRGRILHHAISETGARLMIAHPELIPRLADIAPTPLEQVLSVDQAPSQISGPVPPVTVSSLEDDAIVPVAEPADVHAWDLQMIIFTSGTTGPSKGVMCPYLHEYTVGQGSYGYLTPDDCMLVDLPMFHVGGVSPIMGALANRARVALFNGFKTDQFWRRIHDCGATSISGLIGSMAAFLDKAPVEEGEENNPLRMVTLMLNQQAIDVAKRYRFDYISGFNMTELSVPLVTELNCRVPGSIGRARTGCEVRVVDEHDYECADNEVGELVVRTDQPWRITTGYLNNPEANAAAWRNGWFHTGDLVRRDESGNYFFVDRVKDAVRRRGENVSSLEVESDLLGFASIAEAAVVGVPSELGDEEILAAIAPKPGKVVVEQELVEFLIPKMPHYMVPRYIRILEALPKTPTNKIMKHEIRTQGVTADTWDREAAGIVLKKTRLS